MKAAFRAISAFTAPGGCAYDVDANNNPISAINCSYGYWEQIVACSVDEIDCSNDSTPPDNGGDGALPKPRLAIAYPVCGTGVGSPGTARTALANATVAALATALSSQLKNAPAITVDNALGAVGQAHSDTSLIQWNDILSAGLTNDQLDQDMFHELDHLFWDAIRADGTHGPIPPYDPAHSVVTVYAQGYTLLIDLNVAIVAYEHLFVHNDLVGVLHSDTEGTLDEIFNAKETTVIMNTANGPETLTAAGKAEDLADFKAQNTTAHLAFKGDDDGSLVKAFMAAHGSNCPASSPPQPTMVETYVFAPAYQWTGAR